MAHTITNAVAGASNKKRRPASTEELDHLRELQRARQRLGSDKAKLEWFLNFAEMPLEQLSPTELTLRYYEIWAAAGVDDQTPGELKIIEKTTPSRLPAYQREINKAMQALFSGTGIWELPGNPRLQVHRVSVKGTKEAKFHCGYYFLTDMDLAMRGFLFALQNAGRYLRNCLRCSKIFVATKRQEYCSTNCSQIVRNEKKKQIREEKKAKESRGKL